MTKINPEKLLGKREIKFRAWDRKQKKIIPPFRVFDDVFGDFSPWGGRFLEIELEGDIIDKDYVVDKDNWILMQYTGLKDKNGREVYEGDIVKGKPYKYSEDNVIGVVCFGEAFSSHDSGYIRERYIGWFIADAEGNQIYRYGESVSLLDICENGEVVGNVFENPELLEENGDS